MAQQKNQPEGMVVRLPEGELHFLSAEVLASTRITDPNLKASLEKLISPSGPAQTSQPQMAQVIKVATNYEKIPTTEPLTVKIKPGGPIMLW
jgi:hypothetical protein